MAAQTTEIKVANETKAPKKRRACPATTFRQDYRKHSRVSYLEAVDYVGVTARTIQNWICRRKNPLPVCAKIGPFRIDLIDLDKFLRRGLK